MDSLQLIKILGKHPVLTASPILPEKKHRIHVYLEMAPCKRSQFLTQYSLDALSRNSTENQKKKRRKCFDKWKKMKVNSMLCEPSINTKMGTLPY